QCGQHRPAPAGYLHLQLLLSTRISGWTRRPSPAPLSLRLCLMEIRKGVGNLSQKTVMEKTPKARPRLLCSRAQRKRSRGIPLLCHPERSEGSRFPNPRSSRAKRGIPLPCHPQRSEAKSRDLGSHSKRVSVAALTLVQPEVYFHIDLHGDGMSVFVSGLESPG